MTKFTILFITKGRNDILNSLKSCQEIKKYYSNIEIIILDGNKNNFLNSKLKLLKSKIDIKIIKQKKTGFMSACLEAIEYLDHGYFTFMYDDDFLSPYFGMMVKYSCIKKKQIYGYGKIYPKEKKYIFKKPLIQSISKNKIDFLKEYFKFKSSKVLPNSPITSIFSVKIIKKWKYILRNKTNDEITRYLMMKKNIGPDLLLYLLSLEMDSENCSTLISNNVVAKFSSHKNSMSVTYGSGNLRFGYWVAKKIFIDYIPNKNSIGRDLIMLHLIKGLFTLVIFFIHPKKFKNFSLKNYLSVFYDLLIKIF
jgi:hypothetical protein